MKAWGRAGGWTQLGDFVKNIHTMGCAIVRSPLFENWAGFSSSMIVYLGTF